MPILESVLIDFFQDHRAPIVLAYSGGIDSQVLLHALAALKHQQLIENDLSACYVHHGLSPNADAWQLFTQQQCQLVNIPFKTLKLDLAKQRQHSLEAQAREARYQALQTILPSNGWLVTGHHANDQLETLLLALKRGAGLKGLSAMLPLSKMTQGILARPLLNLSRNDIVNYAQQQHLTWIEDESNDDVHYDRNFLRQQIIPQLTARWPSMLSTVQRSVAHCQDAQTLLDELAQVDLKQCQIDDQRLSVSQLITLTETRFNNVVRYFIAMQQLLMPSQVQLQQLYQQIRAAQDKNPAVNMGAYWFRRYRDQLVITPSYKELTHWQTSISNYADSTVILPDDVGQLKIYTSVMNGTLPFNEPKNSQRLPRHILRLAHPSVGTKLSVRFEHHNPLVHPDNRAHSRSLKKLLQELAIPPWQRKRIPLLFIDDELAALLGYFVCHKFQAKLGEDCLVVQWQR